ncbi:MAG: addiction module antidote protein, HigA family [Betaproteobacteria bacterium RIFCSPLOWO2_12_FULL_67_28]|nr:MAG: addiction module antidote protein, HigA family [Betaproteobacteria bacterium RIFCSPLOWO2_12_FULL_67_28]
MAKKLPPVHPGEMLLEEFLKPMGISQYRLAKEIGVSQRRIGQIVTGKRAISADTDLRLCRFFGLSEGYWLRGQAHYDTEIAKDGMAEVLARILPWKRREDRQAA